MTLYSKILFVKETNYVQITGLRPLRKIIQNIANYAYNYVSS